MNTKKIIAFLLSVSILITMGTFSLSAAAFAGGSGTEEDPFLIETAAQLDEVRQQPAAWYKMVTNITLSGAWTPIGADETAPFTGHFDGNGYAIAGLSVSAANSPTYYGGLFGCNEGTVENLTVEQGTVDVRAANNAAKIYVGGIAGYNKGTVENCVSAATLYASGTYSYAGGIAGYNIGSVLNCGNSGAVTAQRNAGGIAGRNMGRIENSVNRGTNNAVHAGGIVGYQEDGTVLRCLNLGIASGNCVGGITAGNNNGTVEECYNTASFEAMWQGGGIAGSNNGRIRDCFNTGAVTGGWNIGGIVGEQKEGALFNCYNIGAVRGDFAGGLLGLYTKGTVNGCYYLDTAAQGAGEYSHVGSDAGTSIPAEELKDPASLGEFDFESVWETEATAAYEYPTLRQNVWFEYVGIRLAKLPHKTEYPLDWKEGLDLRGAVLQAVYSNGYAEKLPLTVEQVSGFDVSSLGTVELTVVANGEPLHFNITVREPQVTALEIVTLPQKTVYLAGEPFDPQGLTVRAYYDNGEQEMITAYTVETNTAAAGEQPLTVTFGGKSVGTVITVRPAFPFTDVASDWAYAGIEYCYRHGVMNGTAETTFAPKMAMSRAMVVTALYRLSGAPQGAPDAGFADVPQNTWYTDAVNWAAEAGIVNGVGGNDFAPDRTITRVEFVTLLYRYGDYCGEDVSARKDLSSFIDGKEVAPWALEGAEWAVAVSLIQGAPVEGGLALNLQGVATREQAATLLMRYLES